MNEVGGGIGQKRQECKKREVGSSNSGLSSSFNSISSRQWEW